MESSRSMFLVAISYIYIYISRERERERDLYIYIYSNTILCNMIWYYIISGILVYFTAQLHGTVGFRKFDPENRLHALGDFNFQRAV